jgi:DNA-binding NarL/FixJ family response regulator
MIRESVGDLFSIVRECASGVDALAECDAFTPDCVTVDLRMRPMNGLETLARLRNLHPSARYVVVTQFDDAALRDRSRRAGAENYFLKDRLHELRAYLEALPP